MTNDLAAITCFFSYARNSYAIKRYKEFRANLRRQGVTLYTIELAFNDEPFLLRDWDGWGADTSGVYLRYRSDTVLWHKEALLNSLVKRLPPRIKKIAWLDSDIFIHDDNWASKVSNLLDEYRLLQIGSTYRFLKESNLDSGVFDETECRPFKTMGYGFQNDKGNRHDFKKYHVGLAWAASRDFFNKVGLFDHDPTGAGDLITYYSSAGLMDHPSTSWWTKDIYAENCESIMPLVNKYSAKAYEYVQGSIGYLDADVVHRYHGPMSRRGYLSRLDLLKGIDYDKHLERDKNELLKWKENRKGMNKPFEIFFNSKDNHEVKGVSYAGIDKNYEYIT